MQLRDAYSYLCFDFHCVFWNSFSMSISHNMFSKFLNLVMILMPSWHHLKCRLMQVKTMFRKVKHSKQRLLAQGVLWNAEDLEPLHTRTSAKLSAISDCARPKIEQVTDSNSYLYLLKRFKQLFHFNSMSLDYCTRKNFQIKIFTLTSYRTSLQIPFQGNIFLDSN